jgi:hypothetical protein
MQLKNIILQELKRLMNRYHPKIFAANYPILAKYPEDHPAVRVLQVHAEACDKCVAKEIEWPQFGNKAIEQYWFSRTRLKNQSFSAFAYEFISYDLTLDGWLEMATEPTRDERKGLEDKIPLMEELLNECEEAAIDDGNDEILPLISKAREFILCYRKALFHRFEICGIKWRPAPYRIDYKEDEQK